MKTLKALRRQEKELIGSTKDKGVRFFEILNRYTCSIDFPKGKDYKYEISVIAPPFDMKSTYSNDECDLILSVYLLFAKVWIETRDIIAQDYLDQFKSDMDTIEAFLKEEGKI